jgi:hypothetical protein
MPSNSIELTSHRPVQQQDHQAAQPNQNRPASRTPEITPNLDAAPDALAIAAPEQAPVTEPTPTPAEAEVIQPARPARNAMIGNFATRFPRIANALGAFAGFAVYVDVTFELTPSYFLATPLRVLQTVVSTLSPRWGERMARTSMFRALMGEIELTPHRPVQQQDNPPNQNRPASRTAEITPNPDAASDALAIPAPPSPVAPAPEQAPATGPTATPAEAEVVQPARPASRTPEITPNLDAAPDALAIPVPEQAAATGPTAAPDEAEVIQPARPARNAMAGNFATRHPRIVNALAHVAGGAVFLGATLALSPAHFLATPLRLLQTVVSILSPKWGEQMAKPSVIGALMGEMGTVLNQEGIVVRRTRLQAAGVLALEVVSGGVSFSIMNAAINSDKWAKQVRDKTRFALGARRHPEPPVRELTPQEWAMREQHRFNMAQHRESRRAQPLYQTIQRWFDLVSDETPTEGLSNAVWERYDQQFSGLENGAKSFSVLLEKMMHGFNTNFEHSDDPAENTRRQQNKEKVKNFVNERLRPVLMDMQNSDKVAETAFKLAEIGLGTCTDRAVSGWMLLELGTQSVKYSEQFKALCAQGPEKTPEKLQTLLKLVHVETQKFRLDKTREHADALLQDNKRDPARGGWQRAGGFTPYNRIDHVEAVLQLCERVQQTMAPVVTWFPEIPYVAFGSGIRKRDLNRAAGMIIKELIKIEKDPKNTALVEHLMSTDVWRQSLELEYPETRQVTADPLEDCTKAVSCLDDIQDIVNEGGHGEYRKSMEAIGELHKKFSGRGVGKKDSAMKLGAYIDKHLRACEPAKARIDAWLNQMAPTINEARHIENFLNDVSAGSVAFQQALQEAKTRTHPAATTDALEPGQLAAQRQALETARHAIHVLEDVAHPNANQAHELVTQFLTTNHSGLLVSLIAMDGLREKVNAAEGFQNALGAIAAQKNSSFQQVDQTYRQFTMDRVKQSKSQAI